MTGQITAPDTALWLSAAPLVLGSGSKTRQALLLAAGIPLRIRKPDLDEAMLAREALAKGLSPKAIAERLALAKSDAISKLEPNDLILCADQTLDHAGTPFMKPASEDHLRDQLRHLRASTHALHSAAVLRRGSNLLWQGVSTARLTMRDFSDDFLDRYVHAAGPELLNTVGGYQIEALGIHLFSDICGEHAAILGLPMAGLLEALRVEGALAR